MPFAIRAQHDGANLWDAGAGAEPVASDTLAPPEEGVAVYTGRREAEARAEILNGDGSGKAWSVLGDADVISIRAGDAFTAKREEAEKSAEERAAAVKPATRTTFGASEPQPQPATRTTFGASEPTAPARRTTRGV